MPKYPAADFSQEPNVKSRIGQAGSDPVDLTLGKSRFDSPERKVDKIAASTKLDGGRLDS